MSAPSNSVSQPFLVDEFEVEITSLEPTDIGKWALLVTGCYHLFNSLEDARSTRAFILS